MECQIEVWASFGRREFCEEACLHRPKGLARGKLEKVAPSDRLLSILRTRILERSDCMLLLFDWEGWSLGQKLSTSNSIPG